MIDFSISDDEQLIVDNVKKYVEREIMPLENGLLRRGMEGGDEHLSAKELRDLQKKAREVGFWGLDTPEEHGGVGLSPIVQSLVNFELGKSYVGFHFGGSAMNVMYALNDAQKKEYLVPTLNGERWGCFALSEPGVGSDARGIKTTAVRDGDDWIINGEKTWITSGNDADYTIVFARTSNDGMSAFIVDRAMGYKSHPIRTMAPHDPASVTFDNVRVPNRNLCGELNKGFEWAMSFIYRNRGWILPPKNLGAAERMLGMALEHAENRTTFGRKLIERENIMWMIAESELEIRAGKLLILNCAWQASKDMDYRHSACAVKYFTAQAANRIADRVLQIHGGMGLAKELPLERWYRDLRVERIYEGSDEINLATMVRNLRKGHASIGKIN